MSVDADRQQAKMKEFMSLLPLTLELAGLPKCEHGKSFSEGQLGHAEFLLLPQKAEQAVLGKGDVAAREFLGKLQHEAALEDGENIGQPLGVGSQFGGFAQGGHKVKGVYGKGVEPSVNRPE